MSEHIYAIGDYVKIGNTGRYFQKAAEVFTVRAQLPPVGDELQYRIKSAFEPYERVVVENLLSAHTT